MKEKLFESILDDLSSEDNKSSVQTVANQIKGDNQKISYSQWYTNISNGDYEQMFCVSHHFMGEEYAQDIEDFREDLISIIERFFGDNWSMQIVATNKHYEDIGIQKEPGKREGGPLLNFTDMTNNMVRFKFAVEFHESGRQKVFTFLNFISRIYGLIRRPTSANKLPKSNDIRDDGRLEIYPFVNDEVGFVWPGGDNGDCIISSSAYEFRYKKDVSAQKKSEIATVYSGQMEAIDLTRELPEPFEYATYKKLCWEWIRRRIPN